MVVAEAIVRRIAPPERVRTIGVGVAKALTAPGVNDRAEARRMVSRPEVRRSFGMVGAVGLPEGTGRLRPCPSRAGPQGRVRRLDRRGPAAAKTERLAQKLGLSGQMLFTGERHDVDALLPAS